VSITIQVLANSNVLTMPVRKASFLPNTSDIKGKYPGEVEADGSNMAGDDGVSWSEAVSTNIAAVKTGLNNVAEVNETGGKAGGLVRILKGLNGCYRRYPHLWYVRA